MRAALAFLFVAGGIITAASESSAQCPLPQQAGGDVQEGMAPIVHHVCGGGIGQNGYFCRPIIGCGHGCGCGDDGNCACHGSYKYPVPSQYTWFWPGIYSQRTMTQYISPWRYPDLNPIPEYWKLDPTEDRSSYSGYKY